VGAPRNLSLLSRHRNAENVAGRLGLATRSQSVVSSGAWLSWAPAWCLPSRRRLHRGPNSGAGSRLRTRIRAGCGTGQPHQCRWRRARVGCFVRCLIGRIHHNQMGWGSLPRVPRHPVVAGGIGHPECESAGAAEAIAEVVRDGFPAALLNPKTTLFFAAFLPQFMDAHAGPLMQTLAPGGSWSTLPAARTSCMC
jgi:hypothetical protein